MFNCRDLSHNLIVHLGSKAFNNLTELRNLRLHSQRAGAGLESIQFDAFVDINTNLVEL